VLLHERPIGAVLLLYDLDEITDRTKLYSTIVFAVLLVSGLLAFLLSSSLRALITAPILRLVEATTAVSETGDYGIRAQRHSNDELGVLVDRFNEMLAGIESRDVTLTKALGEREEALSEAERAHERFRFMAESMPQKIFTATAAGTVNYLNRQWADYTGVSPEELDKTGLLRFIHPDDQDQVQREWRHSLETAEPFHCELRFLRADGEYRWHLSRAHAMRDSQGKISIWIGSHTEIHQQKEKEEELRRANEDLQQFVYSASHDLQEPVRNVAIYSEIVARRYDQTLDERGRQYLGFLREGGRRLATLIRDLLAYTRADVVEGPKTQVDSMKVLQRTLSDLAEAIRESGAIVNFDPLPEVFMGEAHLQQIFQNLITNAIKYRNEDTPRIHVSAAKSVDGWRFSVADNGIGIDPQYKEKIFGVFKRLHHNERYGGTGIGLAICQRVVERYGGRIWVESEEGKGATFFFTIPQQVRRVDSTFESVAG
jgi:PAS domain S-box-containing protein